MRGVSRVLLLPLAALALVASGCGSDDRPASADRPPAAASTAASPSRPASSSPGTPAASSPAPRGHLAPSPRDPHRGAGAHRHRQGHKTASLFTLQRSSVGAHLLAGDRMPGLADGFTWAVVDNGPEDSRAVGACQKTGLETIGATSAVRRSYAAADGSAATASQVVARFADKVSAARAHAVLASWRDDCEQRLDLPRTDIGPLQPVVVRSGTGDSYDAAYGSRAGDRTHAGAVGIFWKGRYLSVVEVMAGPQSYPRGWDPARAAVRRIARTFTAS